MWPELKQISQPTFILTGEDDIGSNPEMAKQMHKEIAHSEVFIVPGMKHMLPMEGADIVNKAIRFFIEKQAIPAK